MICPVVAYAPKAATKPSIAAQPLNFSASGDMAFMKSETNIKKNLFSCDFLLTGFNYISLFYLYVRLI